MSDQDDKFKEFEGQTFQKIIAESMHKGSMVHAVSKMVESFSEDKREEVLTSVQGLAGFVDRIKFLLAQAEAEQEQEPTEPEQEQEDG